MRYEVKDPGLLEKEAQERQAKFGIWPKGKYDFEILSASEATSKSSGKPMIILDLRVFNDDGHTKDLKDYISASQPDKLYALSKSIGQERMYLSGNIEPSDLPGAAGKCIVAIELGEYNGEKTHKNKVAFYVPKGTTQPSAGPRPHAHDPGFPRPTPPTHAYEDELDTSNIPF